MNPRKITTIGARTRRHAPVRAPARKLHAPPRAAVPTVSKTHSSGHRIEQWIPPSGSSSPDLKNGVKNGLIGAATRRHAPVEAPAVSPRQHVPACANACQAHASHTPGTRLASHLSQPDPKPIRTRTGSELIRAGTEPGPSRIRTGPSRSEPEPSQDRAGPDPDPNRTRTDCKKKKKKKKKKRQKIAEKYRVSRRIQGSLSSLLNFFNCKYLIMIIINPMHIVVTN
jgi:hypothetical protein